MHPISNYSLISQESIALNLTLVDPATLKIYNKGQEVPLNVQGQDDGRFDADDHIEYFGQKNASDNTGFDPYTDTNVYWLTWNGEPGLRYHYRESNSDSQTVIHDYIESVHLEQDRIYYHGFSDYQIHDTELVAGEGWIWRFFYPGESETIQIPITFFSGNVTPGQIKVKLRGTTVDPITPNHHVQIMLNDVLLGDFYFNGVVDYLFEAAAPKIDNGENKLVIKSIGDTGAQLDQFYLDWVELDYPRQLTAMNDKLEFRLPENNGKSIEATIWGFTDPNIQLFNLTNHSLIESAVVNAGKRVMLKAVSAGFNDGNYAKLFVDSEPIISAGRRGHNLAVVDETTGAVLDIQYFDTYASSTDADKMANYIQNLPDGRIVLAAIRDEGSAKMTENAYKALESLGSRLTRNAGARDSWAMIGRAGAQLGEAVEMLTVKGTGIAVVQDTLIFPGTENNYYLTFNDSMHSEQSYFAVSNNGKMSPKAAALDTFANLKSTQKGADLIIISHQKFLDHAHELGKFHESRNNLRVSVIDVAEIYDEFNYGILNPAAIKEFLEYTYFSWQSPAPSYVIFFGDASWDFKKNLSPASKENYVPSYGNPVSDNWYVCFDGADDFLPEMFVGRIPVETVEQAGIVINKIIAYENTPSESWKKDLLFITGGFDATEHRMFMNQSNYLIQNYVLPPPASCRALQINKTTEGYFEGEKKPEVLAAMNKGLLWVNFVGHAGSRTWDLMFSHPDIEELSNENKYPFITSMTCHTGRFANPELDSFGEHFLLADRKGAIAFWGTTGWGYVFQDNVLLKNIFKGTMVDTMHTLGPATTYAKLKLWEGYGGGIYNINTINQYTLLGDPVIDLALPKQPDLTIGPQDVTFSPVAASEADSIVTIKIKLQNWGLATRDSFQVEVSDNWNNEFIHIATLSIAPLMGYSDSLIVPWKIVNQAGQHAIHVVLDPKNHIDEVDENNNSHSYSTYVYSSKISISKPVDFQVIAPQGIVLQVNNPAIAPSEKIQRYFQFELDTSIAFNSPMRITSPQITEGIIVTRWSAPELLDQQTYFWRCRVIEGVETGNWVMASFTTKSESENVTWMQKHPNQLRQNHFKNTKISESGGQLISRSYAMLVESAGYTDGNFARIAINSVSVVEQHRGHNLVVVSPSTGQVLTQRSFDTWLSQDEANAMANFIASQKNGTYVLAAIKDDGSFNMNEAAYQSLESIGSQYCRNVKFRDSWAIVGKKGAQVGTVLERFSPQGQGVAVLEDTLVNYPTKGTIVSPPIGPSNGWNYLSWIDDRSGSGSTITMDLIGYNKKTSSWDTLKANLFNNLQEQLNSIDARHYPLLKFKANLSDDDGLDTPLLKEWTTSYEPVADPAISNQVVTFNADSLMEGNELKMEIKIFNTGMVLADSVKLRFGLGTPDSGKVRLFEDKLLTRIAVDSFKILNQSWDGIGRIGNSQLFIEIDPEDQVNELTEGNNYFSRQVVVLSDTMKPRISVTYDGKSIVMEDFVSKQPVILIDVFDNSILSGTSDTTQVNLFLDNDRISFSGNENVLHLLPLNKSEDPKLRARLKFTPQLFDGDHSLEVIVRDYRNNVAYHRNFFQVVSDFKLLNVLNYPNPFQNDTEFTFQLTQPADKVTIKIFTVAGRLIRTIENHNYEAGFHRIYWNGLDQDLDIPANGVYLYKIIARAGTNQVEKIDKLVIIK
ncbi:MAG: C25 family cysteine peptidase [bacterium]|nr:C25 family cysteine peptidase [bacterium]